MFNAKYLPCFVIAATAAAVMLTGQASYADEDPFAKLSDDSQMSLSDLGTSAGLGAEDDGLTIYQTGTGDDYNGLYLAYKNQNAYVNAENEAEGEVNIYQCNDTDCGELDLGYSGDIKIIGAMGNGHGAFNLADNTGNAAVNQANMIILFNYFAPTLHVGK